MKDKDARDDLVKPHTLEEGEWVLVRHERPLKFESKWFGPYQIIEKKLLGTYRLCRITAPPCRECYELSDMNYPIWIMRNGMRNEGGLAKDGVACFG